MSLPRRAAANRTPGGEPLRLRVFIDRRVVEVFANKKQYLAIRAYPEREDSLGVSLRAQSQDAVPKQLAVWNDEIYLGLSYSALYGDAYITSVMIPPARIDVVAAHPAATLMRPSTGFVSIFASSRTKLTKSLQIRSSDSKLPSFCS